MKLTKTVAGVSVRVDFTHPIYGNAAVPAPLSDNRLTYATAKALRDALIAYFEASK